MKTNSPQPEFLFFAQHGWSDRGNDIGQLARALASENTTVFAPSLGILNTYWRIESLIQQVENLAYDKIARHPQVPLKIMGHSMGGLIWLEVLNRHPEWWQKIHSLVVIGSPIGGADLARLIDPLGIGIGIARDLGRNRRFLAEKIAQKIPTLSIASDLGNGSDGMVSVASTKFAHSRFVCLEGILHARLKVHFDLIPIIHDFWSNPQIDRFKPDFATKVIRHLQQIPGMTDASHNHIERSQLLYHLPQGIGIRTYKNWANITRVFVTDRRRNCLYAGYVGWLHQSRLEQTLEKLKSNNLKL